MTFSVAFWSVVGSLNTDIVLRCEEKQENNKDKEKYVQTKAKQIYPQLKMKQGLHSKSRGWVRKRRARINYKGHRMLFGVMGVSFTSIPLYFTKYFTS